MKAGRDHLSRHLPVIPDPLVCLSAILPIREGKPFTLLKLLGRISRVFPQELVVGIIGPVECRRYIQHSLSAPRESDLDQVAGGWRTIAGTPATY